MTFRSLLAVFAIVSLVVGCGESSQEADQEAQREFFNEVLLVNGDFQEIARESTRRITAARTEEDLEDAYSDYAEALSGQRDRLEEIDPPEACEDLQESMLGFVGKLIGAMEQLSHQENFDSQSDLAAVQRDVASAQSGLREAALRRSPCGDL